MTKNYLILFILSLSIAACNFKALTPAATEYIEFRIDGDEAVRYNKDGTSSAFASRNGGINPFLQQVMISGVSVHTEPNTVLDMSILVGANNPFKPTTYTQDSSAVISFSYSKVNSLTQVASEVFYIGADSLEIHNVTFDSIVYQKGGVMKGHFRFDNAKKLTEADPNTMTTHKIEGSFRFTFND